MKAKSKLVVRNVEIKKEVENVMFKLKKKTFQRAAKFIMAGFSEMDFVKDIVILVIVDEMYKVLKSPLTNRFWSRGGIG